MLRSLLCVAVWLLGTLCASNLRGATPPKLRVFILAGQSNMEGKGAITHLLQVINEKPTGIYSTLKDRQGWSERDDVSIKFFNRHGPLTVGYGVPENRIGPELGFGHVVGNRYDEHVLLIKTAWGGRSLAVDYRSPSSGVGHFQQRDRKTGDLVPIPSENYGRAYREMLTEIRETLASIDKYVPSGVASAGYELSGFVWFQGFNDVINDEYTAEYERCLINLIRDVRVDLGVEGLPFIIGELGQQGTQPEPRYAAKHIKFRRIQKSVAERSELKQSVSFVKTSPYVIGDAESFDGGYHYFGRADTFVSIGDAFARAILLLCRDIPVNHAQSN